jgi:OOP family OmpA-OmpF porin
VACVLLFPVTGSAGERYAQSGDGSVLVNSAGECWQAVHGVDTWCGEIPDSDGDGVTDDRDRCPDTPAGQRVNEYGCGPDGDRDGVLDAMDQCPDTRYGVRVNSRGCDLDIDGDGVPYYRDRCQTTPPGMQVDEHGCTRAVLDDILFEFDKASLRPDGKAYLDKLAPTLENLPRGTSIRVTGHADSVGSKGYNQRLSEARARTVKNYLQAKGLKTPVVSAGRGETQPAASNATAAGRSLNRRVEIRVDHQPR